MNVDKVAILIKKAALEFDKMGGAALEKYDLTLTQYKFLKYLYEEAENGVRIVDLEKFYSMTHPAAIGIVQNLEKKGLVTYQKNPNHARSRFVVPTENALQMRSDMEAVGVKIEKEFTKNLSERESDQIIVLLKRLLGIKEQ